MLKKDDFNFLSSNKFYYLLFAIVSIIITILNLGGPYIVHFIDIMWPLNPIQSIRNSFYIWNFDDYGYFNGINIFNFQYYLFISLLSFFPTYIQEIILLSGLQFIGAVYVFKIFNEFIFNKDQVLVKALSFAAAFPIIFSNYYWWDFIPIGFFLISFGAMFIYYLLAFFSNYIMNGKFNYKFLFLMGISSMLSFSSNAPINANLILLAVIMPLFLVTRGTRKIRIAVFYLSMLSLILFTNLWWILPSYMATIFGNTSLGNVNNVYILGLNSSSANFINILEFVHVNVPYIGLEGNSGLNNIFYDLSTYLSIILLLLVAFAFFRNKEKFRKEYFLSLIFVILLDLVMMGINSPFKSLEVYLINTNGILSEYLRGDPGSLSMIMFFLLTVLITISVYILIESYSGTFKKAQHKAITIFLLSLLILSFIIIAPQNYDGYAIPHYPYRARMVVPSFDSEVASFIEKNTGQSYTLLYPGGFLEQNTTHGYDSYDILPSLIPQSLLIDSRSNIMLDNIYNYIGSGSLNENFSYYLYSQNIKYIIIEGEVGGNYPFGFFAPPDYRTILSHLNNTFGIEMVKKFGPDYIYQANNLPQGMISKAKIFSNKNIINGDILPVANITREYFNDTVSNRTIYEPNGTYNNGINFNINKTSWDIISNLSYNYSGAEPIFYNSKPLNINTSTNSVLILKLKGNNNTIISPNIMTSSNITLYSILHPSDLVHNGYPYNNLRDNNATTTKDYGCNHYLMSNNTMTMVINLNSATKGKKVNFIYFFVASLNKVYGSDLNFTIESMELGTYYSSAYGKFLVSNSFRYNYNYTMKYVQNGYSDYLVNTYISNGTGPIVFSLFTSYSPYWEVKGISGVSSYRLIILNNDTTGVIIYPKSSQNHIEFVLFYGPQKTYVNIEFSLIFAYLVFFTSLLMLYEKNRSAAIIKRIAKKLKIFKNS